MHDLVIGNAFVVDGAGGPGRLADVAVGGSLITAVEQAVSIAAGRRVVDADGLLLTPGFVDVHTHYDAQATWDPFVTPSGWHGVTTVMVGNCGVGFAPAAPDRHDWLVQLMEGVEDIPGTALAEGITWNWETYPQYLDELARLPRVMDVGSQIGHGPLRTQVARIADAMRRAGHGVFQFAPDHALVPVQEWPWMRKVAALTGQSVSVNLNQPDSAPDLWRDVLRLLDEAHADGLDIVAQVAGRSIGILYCLRGSFHPLLFHPAYQEIAGLPIAAQLTALGEPERRRRIIDDMPTVLDHFGPMWCVEGGNIDYEPAAVDSVTAVAARRGVPPMQLVLDQLTAREAHGPQRRWHPLRGDLRRRHPRRSCSPTGPAIAAAARSFRSN
jgi:N-acyl-D-amino-acid deacylase